MTRTGTGAGAGAGVSAVVYTILPDACRAPLAAGPAGAGIRWVALSRRRPVLARGWEWRPLQAPAGAAPPNRVAAWARTFPHLVFPEAAISLRIDADMMTGEGLPALLEEFAASGAALGMFRHPDRDDVFAEAAAWEAALKAAGKGAARAGDGAGDADGRARLADLLRRCREGGLPAEHGLADGKALLRRHDHPALAPAMALWWEEILAGPGPEQVGLAWARHAAGAPTKIWDWSPRIRNPVFRLARRAPAGPLKADLALAVEEERTRDLATALAAAGLAAGQALRGRLHPQPRPKPRAQPARPAAGGRPRPLVFLYAEARKTNGSTVMRSLQLSELVRPALPEREVLCSSDMDHRDSIILVSKGALQTASLEALSRLRARGNVLIADFVDGAPDAGRLALMDGAAASSLSAQAHYRRIWPGLPCFHITHHVDPRIPPGNQARDFSLGYFGEPPNAVWSWRIRRQATLVPVDTGRQVNDWLTRTGEFNIHYGVRPTRAGSGFKPFLKGFVAARCKANLVMGRAVSDALEYLGEDYPFLLPEDPTEDQILGVIDDARAAFGGPLWARALERMAEVERRSSDDWVRDEVRAMLAEL